DHIVPPVLHQKKGERSEITVGQRFLVYIFQYLRPVRNIFSIELISQFFVKCIIKIVLYHFFAQVGPASLVPKDIPEPGTVLGYLFSIEITGKTTRAQVTGNTFGRSAKRYRCSHKIMRHIHLRPRKSLTDSLLDNFLVVSAQATLTIKINHIHSCLPQPRQQLLP